MFSNDRARRALWSLAFVGLTPAALLAADPILVSPSVSPSVERAASSGALDRAPSPLTEALRRVWQRSPALQAAEAKLATAEARGLSATRPIYNPDLELTAENADVDTRSIGLSQTIDWSGKRRARSDAAAAQVRAAQAERDQVRQRIALQWLSGFSAYRVACEQVDLGARRVAVLERFAALAQRRLAAGDIAPLESDLAELALQEAGAQQAGLLADQAKARQIVAAIAADDAVPLPELPLRLPPQATLPLAPATIETLPALQQAVAEVDAADARIGVAERDRRPDPTISLTGGRVSNGAVSDKVVGIHVRIPLFVRNDYSADVSAARAAADEAAATLHERRLLAIAEAEQTATGYNALRDAWQTWERRRAARADDRAALLQRLWEAGELSTADYLVQLKQSIDTDLSAATLRARAWQAFADWLGASGGLDRWLGLEGSAP
jgi:cobalt-zinc-cadmium efflux system outer membrane protein